MRESCRIFKISFTQKVGIHQERLDERRLHDRTELLQFHVESGQLYWNDAQYSQTNP